MAHTAAKDAQANKDEDFYALTWTHPNMLITQVQLNQDNFFFLAEVIKTSLSAMNKLGFIEGTLQQPHDDDDDSNLED